MDFKKIKKVYMIGIKGSGMAQLARYFAENGKEVIGSDVAENFPTSEESLEHENIRILLGFDENNIDPGSDLIIYSTAYKPEKNPEVRKALDGRIKAVNYPEALSAVFNQKYGIAVVGSHGKTTTTAWLGYVLLEAGFRPNVIVGSIVPQFKGGSLVGGSDYFVAEVDEYQNKLRYFNPRAVLLNNIDYDHPDFFLSREDYEKVFADFIKRIPAKGILIANFDDPVVRRLSSVNCPARVLSYAIGNKADYEAYEIKNDGARQVFKVRTREDDESFELGSFTISLAGRHNISNALAVIAMSVQLDIPLKDIRGYLAEFRGTNRRMQVLGEYNGGLFIDDYAHHPTEIKTTLEGIKSRYRGRFLTVVFHPHTFTRTKALMDDFSKCFSKADKVIVLDIFGSAREEQGGVHSTEMVSKIKEEEPEKEVVYIPTLAECEEYLKKNVGNGDIVVLMGAGDVFQVADNLIK